MSELAEYKEMIAPFIGKIVSVPNFFIANHPDLFFIIGFEGDVLRYQKCNRHGRKLKGYHSVYNFENWYNSLKRKDIKIYKK